MSLCALYSSLGSKKLCQETDRYAANADLRDTEWRLQKVMKKSLIDKIKYMKHEIIHSSKFISAHGAANCLRLWWLQAWVVWVWCLATLCGDHSSLRPTIQISTLSHARLIYLHMPSSQYTLSFHPQDMLWLLLEIGIYLECSVLAYGSDRGTVSHRVTGPVCKLPGA